MARSLARLARDEPRCTGNDLEEVHAMALSFKSRVLLIDILSQAGLLGGIGNPADEGGGGGCGCSCSCSCSCTCTCTSTDKLDELTEEELAALKAQLAGTLATVDRIAADVAAREQSPADLGALEQGLETALQDVRARRGA
jgi:hypothetical protein